VKDVYGKVYDAERPELFLKAVGWRVVGPQMPIRVRDDSHWNVPEPEVTLVINRHGEIVGFTAGNDVSSRDIEGENPLYLPQAKIYNRSCALGPGIRLADAASLTDVPIKVSIARDGKTVFEGDTSSAQMKRTFQELAKYLGMELDFPRGVLLMTGTGIVPGDDFNLQSGDLVTIKVDTLILENEVMA
jgi:2-dehydro-3-deoxy-D-arabinonate dehydratase